MWRTPNGKWSVGWVNKQARVVEKTGLESESAARAFVRNLLLVLGDRPVVVGRPETQA